ncbi:hypothetical protein WOC76_12600 [Methylocystis sp. IM3]|uniref:hypothetical protein n=1 Tax=unclassified Methylocystis TaxID=2625913 RepID=UPI0030FB5286
MNIADDACLPERITLADALEELSSIKRHAKAVEISINGAALCVDERNALCTLAADVHRRIDRLEGLIDKQELSDMADAEDLAEPAAIAQPEIVN